MASSPSSTPPLPYDHPLNSPPNVRKPTTLRHLHQLHSLSIKTHLPTPSHLLTLSTRLSPPSPLYSHHLFHSTPSPTLPHLNALLRLLASSPHPFLAFLLFSSSPLPPDRYSFPSLLKACANSKSFHQGTQTHALAIKLEFDGNAFVVPTLISMYAECGDVKAARKVFDTRTQRACVVCYNAMIAACAKGSRAGEALALFREMQAEGLEPTYVTVLSVTVSCALVGSLELGRWIHDYVRKNGFERNVKVNTALIDMYAKCGSLEDAKKVFDEMESKDTQAWSAMIVAYAIHGHGEMALTLFENMKRDGIKPDAITFLGLLYACSHAGLVEQGLRYFHSMRKAYGVIPGIKHFGCVVDILARAGRLDEAYEFIDGLPIKPTPILWRTLLSACGGHGNVELGKRVFEKICELDKSHGGDYVILSNMCASKGKWEDVDYIRKLMKDRGVVKVPGCSSIEIENRVHEFFASDGKHPQTKELRRTVDEVVMQLKMAGYEPDTSQVFHPNLSQDEKEANLRYHSEKLAIGFGLMNTPPGTTIRVVKNLRVCGDCHSMAKLTSLVFNRQIILRDVNRFHHFKNGECSCRDFW